MLRYLIQNHENKLRHLAVKLIEERDPFEYVKLAQVMTVYNNELVIMKRQKEAKAQHQHEDDDDD